MLARLFKFLLNRLFLMILGLLALSLVIWFVGPLIAIASFHPLESAWVRAILIGLILAFYLGKYLWQLTKARLANAQLMRGLAEQSAAPADSENETQVQERLTLQKRFTEDLSGLAHRDSGS